LLSKGHFDLQIDNSSDYMLIKSREMSVQDCEALGCDHARFGMSLANLGDTNNDGFPGKICHHSVLEPYVQAHYEARE
jgi:hypothetical protein